MVILFSTPTKSCQMSAKILVVFSPSDYNKWTFNSSKRTLMIKVNVFIFFFSQLMCSVSAEIVTQLSLRSMHCSLSFQHVRGQQLSNWIDNERALWAKVWMWFNSKRVLCSLFQRWDFCLWTLLISHDVYVWCFRSQNTWIELKSHCIKRKIPFSTIACASILFDPLSSPSTHEQIC